MSLLLCVLAASAGVRAQPGIVERIEVQGLSRMDPLHFPPLLGIKEGDPYDLRRIQGQFRVLWDQRLFEDITIETETGPQGGQVLIIKLRERPVVAAVSFEENKVLTRTQIEDQFKERGIKLSVGDVLDLGQVYFAEAAIRDLFSQKGFLDATVEVELEDVTVTSRAIEFKMIPGGKTRIRSIEFTGNRVFPDRKLKRLLKLTQERKWYWPWSAKNLYHPFKWDQDAGAIRDAYQNRGYLDIETHAPDVQILQKKQEKKDADEAPPAAVAPAAPAAAAAAAEPAADEAVAQPLEPKRRAKLEKAARERARKERKREVQAKKKASRRRVYLTVAVTEGRQYTLGRISFSGNEVFTEDLLRKQIPLTEGELLNNGALKQGVNRITRLYEDRGYLYAKVVQRIDRREAGDAADVAITLDEDRPYRVGRIDFRGNTDTNDRVLRREMALAEGDLFNRTNLEVSRTKINQLGFFQLTGEPLIEPIEHEGQVRVTLAGQEQSRSEIQVGGGYSGFDGAFFSGVYSTRNFLGRGQVFSTTLQLGGNRNLYQISFQEPWFLGRPYIFGASLFRRETDYGNNLESTSDGGGLQLGRLLGNFSRIDLHYTFETVTSTSLVSTFDPISGQAVQIQTAVSSRVSSLTPAYRFSTVNNPYRPSRGTSVDWRTQVAGGPLGGDFSYVKPLITLTRYQRVVGRSFAAVHAEVGLVRAFGEQALSGNSVEEVPRYQRFWLGGDTLGPRVFETRTITPRRFAKIVDGIIVDVTGDITGQPPDGWVFLEIGGDRMYLLQTEWVFPLNPQAELALFVDAGDALAEDTDLDFSTVRASTGIELRFHLPVFPVPLRLIYGIPLRELDNDSTSNFMFSLGRSF